MTECRAEGNAIHLLNLALAQPSHSRRCTTQVLQGYVICLSPPPTSILSVLGTGIYMHVLINAVFLVFSLCFLGNPGVYCTLVSMYETVSWHRPSDVRPRQSPRLTKTEEQTNPELKAPIQGPRGEFLRGKSDSFSPLLDCPGAQVFFAGGACAGGRH